MAKRTEASDQVGGLEDSARSLVDRGQTLIGHLPDGVHGARSAVNAASASLEELSDQGVIAAVGLSAGLTIGLLLAGAPRVVLALALVPTAITIRSAMGRGVGPARLVKRRGSRALLDET